jgi:hypothetical protein
MSRHIGSVVVSVLVLAASGCRNDCRTFCSKLHDCMDAEIDVDLCQTNCDDLARVDESHANEIRTCAECSDASPLCSEEVHNTCFAQCGAWFTRVFQLDRQ